MIFLIKAFVTVFGIGYIRIAPGTFGSLFAILVWYISINYLNIYFFYTIIIIVFIFSFKAINIYLRNENKDDPSEIVVDEFIGQSIPVILFEIFHGDRNYSAYDTIQIYLWFFLLFRVFDGLKPFPIDYVDKKFKNSFGILFDDILAGVYVVLCLILFMVGKTYLLQ